MRLLQQVGALTCILRTVLIVFISLAMNLKREPYIDGFIPMLCLIAVCIPVM